MFLHVAVRGGFDLIHLHRGTAGFFRNEKSVHSKRVRPHQKTPIVYIHSAKVFLSMKRLLPGGSYLSGFAAVVLACVCFGYAQNGSAGTNLTVVPGVTSMTIRWTTSESRFEDVEQVLVLYSDTNYPEIDDTHLDTAAFVAPRTTNGVHDAGVADLSPETRYYCSIFLVDSSGNQVRADTASGLTRSSYTDPFNPVTVTGERIDSAHVKIELRGYTGIPTWNFDEANPDPFLDSTFADTVGVWWSSTEVPSVPSPSNANLSRYLLFDIQKVAEPFLDTITVSPLDTDVDSLYWFNTSLFWTNPDSIIVFDTGNGSAVDMVDRRIPSNPLQISGTYLDVAGNDSVTVFLTNLDSVEAGLVDRVIVQLAEDSAGVETIVADTFLLSEAQAASHTNEFSYGVIDSRFNERRDTVYCFVRLVSHNQVISGPAMSFFAVGHDIPDNPVVLTATAIGPARIVLSWNPLGVNVEVLRIVYDATAIPLGTEIDPDGYDGVLTPFPTARFDTLTGLEPQTRYYFGAQVSEKGVWSYVDAAARAKAVTQPVDTSLVVDNSITIDKAYFEGTTNRICVVWTRDTTVDSLEYGIAYGLDSISTAQGGYKWIPASSRSLDTAWIVPGARIVFDTTYHIFMQLRHEGGLASGTTKAAHARATTPSFTFQPVSYFTSGPTADTVLVDNGRFLLWHAGTWVSGLVHDTIRSVTIPSQQSQGFVTIGSGYKFSSGNESQPVSLGLSWTELPSFVDPADIRLYRFSPGSQQWTVEWNAVIDTSLGLVFIATRELRGSVFVLAVDTAAPEVTVKSDASSVVDVGKDIVNRLQVGDNCANSAVVVKYAKGGEGWGDGIDSLILDGTDSLLVITIPRTLVTDENGTRCYVSVSDGSNQRFVDLSRQVNLRSSTIDRSVAANTWTPIHAVALLENKAARSVMSEVLKDGVDWTYDNTRVRLMRWWDHRDNLSSSGDWLEYNDSYSALFDLVPGRVLWIKTKELLRFDYGDGVTLSLRDTLTITVPPSRAGKMTWVDFAVPYKFNMFIGDILDATNDPNTAELQFYHWVAPTHNGAAFSTEILYIGESGLPDWMNRRAELSGGVADGDVYTVYNPTPDSIVLKFPSVPRDLSTVTNDDLGKMVSSDAPWWVQVTGNSFGPVTLGFVGAQGQKRQARTWYPSAPTFSAVSMQVHDPVQGKSFGHVLAHQAVDGGFSYELLLRNGSTKASTCTWEIDRSHLPATMDALYWEPATGESRLIRGVEGFSKNLAGDAVVSAFVLVGDAGYFERFKTGVNTWTFDVLKAFPNPFRSSVAIRYTAPCSGIAGVRCSIINSQGRQVWASSQSKPPMGVNVMTWNGLSFAGRRVAGGLYLARITAFNSAGDVVGNKEQQLLLIR